MQWAGSTFNTQVNLPCWRRAGRGLAGQEAWLQIFIIYATGLTLATRSFLGRFGSDRGHSEESTTTPAVVHTIQPCLEHVDSGVPGQPYISCGMSSEWRHPYCPL